MPRDALRQVLERSGVSPQMLQIIRSFHEDMQTQVGIGHWWCIVLILKWSPARIPILLNHP